MRSVPTMRVSVPSDNAVMQTAAAGSDACVTAIEITATTAAAAVGAIDLTSGTP